MRVLSRTNDNKVFFKKSSNAIILNYFLEIFGQKRAFILKPKTSIKYCNILEVYKLSLFGPWDHPLGPTFNKTRPSSTCSNSVVN